MSSFEGRQICRACNKNYKEDNQIVCDECHGNSR